MSHSSQIWCHCETRGIATVFFVQIKVIKIMNKLAKDVLHGKILKKNKSISILALKILSLLMKYFSLENWTYLYTIWVMLDENFG